MLRLSLLLVILVSLSYGCKEDPQESCTSNDFGCSNDAEATACCTDGADCKYTYNGKTYGDSDAERAKLIADMCPQASVVVKTETLAALKSQTQKLILEASTCYECR